MTDERSSVRGVEVDDEAGLNAAGRLLDAFNREYDDPTPGPEPLAARLGELIADGDTVVLVAQEADEPIGLAVVRLHKAIWTLALEAYLAELYVVPERRGRGVGQSLMRAWLDRARDLDADYAYLITSEDDVAARYLYAKNGFRRTEGEDGPLMCALEREL